MFPHCVCDLGPIWRLWMGIEGMDGLLLLFTAIASHKCPGTRFAGFCPLKRGTRRQYFWMPLNILQHVSTLYLGPIWRLWMGIEGMDGLLLLFTAIASRKKHLGASSFADFRPLERRTRRQYFWMPLNIFQHVSTLS